MARRREPITWQRDAVAIARAHAALHGDDADDALAVEVVRLRSCGLRPLAVAEQLLVHPETVRRVLGTLSPPSATTRPVRTSAAGVGGGDPLSESHPLTAATAATE